jgi:probable HAF family extracellular repeat protein
MKSRTWMWTIAVCLFVALATPVWTAAQDNPSPNYHQHHTYKLIDLGTFGGPNGSVPAPTNRDINTRGTAIGLAETSVPDPYIPNCWSSDCLVNHSFEWNGVLTDLGALPGANSTYPVGINDRGEVAGISENGLIDPLTGYPEVDAVRWRHGTIKDLGTLGGNASYAEAIGNNGLVVGEANNTVPDPYSSGFASNNLFFPVATQRHAVSWKDDTISDLGTLGGPDSSALYLNKRGQIAGLSLTSYTANNAQDPCGANIPPTHPFIILQGGGMTDLGTLGGTCGYANWLNNEGQVVGESTFPGDTTFHPFLWTNPGPMQDLGTLGGANGRANWMNDAGDVVGRADLPGSATHDAFLWQNGMMKDLGTLPGDSCSNAHNINSKSQIVGCSTTCGPCLRAFLWENGGPMVDLNTLVSSHADVQLVGNSTYISDRGEILLDGTLSNGDARAFLLIPCDENHQGQCEDNSMIEVPDTVSASQSRATTREDNASPASADDPSRTRFGLRHSMPGQAFTPRD